MFPRLNKYKKNNSSEESHNLHSLTWLRQQGSSSDYHSYSLTSLKFPPANWRVTQKSQFLLHLVLATVNFGSGVRVSVWKTRWSRFSVYSVTPCQPEDTHTENSTKTTDINYSSHPPPTPPERVRWLFDLGYCLLQALMARNAFGSTFLEGISTPPSLPAQSRAFLHQTDKGKPNPWHLFQLWLLQLSTQRNIWILMCTLSLIGLMWWFRMWII